MIRPLILTAPILLLAACQNPTATVPPAITSDPTNDARIEQEIVSACTASGLFKVISGAVTIAVPAATLPVQVLNAGVDKVCADPARYAEIAGTIEWVTKNLRDILAAQKAAVRH